MKKPKTKPSSFEIGYDKKGLSDLSVAIDYFDEFIENDENFEKRLLLGAVVDLLFALPLPDVLTILQLNLVTPLSKDEGGFVGNRLDAWAGSLSGKKRNK